MNYKKLLPSSAIGLMLATTASAAVFVDNFNNGTAANSDSVTGFWNVSTGNGPGDANAVSESGSVLSLSVGDDDGTNAANYSGVSMVSTVSSDFNFFSQALTFEVRGISFSGSTAFAQQQLRLGLNSTSAPSYNSPDAVVFRLKGDGTFQLGSKFDTPNSNSDGVSITNGDYGANNSVTGFDLTLGPGSTGNIDYSVSVFGSGAPVNTSGSFALDSADWGAAGNSSLMLWAQEFNVTGGNENYTVTMDSINVVPEPSSTALLGLGGLTLILRRRR